MSSVAKGDRFEATVYEYFRRLINDGRFFASPDSCRIFHKKRYHSRDRGAEITFDIAIEVYMPGSDSYSLLVLIECKDYTSPVEVGDVEHLFSRIQQVSGGNTKGIIVTTSALQSAALSFARSKGIGVARHFGKKHLKWTLRRTPASWGFRQTDQEATPNVLRALESEAYASPSYEFYCWSGDRGTNSIAELLFDTIRSHMAPEAAHLLIADVAEEEMVPYRTRDAIDGVVVQLLEQIGYRSGHVPLDAICEQQFSRTGLRCEHRAPTAEEAEQRTLGHIEFRRNVGRVPIIV